jgi:hypothetical protein
MRRVNTFKNGPINAEEAKGRQRGVSCMADIIGRRSSASSREDTVAPRSSRFNDERDPRIA